ncbi:MAG TPA: hypothetical protein VGA39_04075, partial [Candidatus Acidoferrales bacterium]
LTVPPEEASLMASQVLSLRSMRGGGKLNMLLALAITAILVLSAWRIVPVYVKSYQFQDEIRSKCKFAPVDRKSPETVKEELLRFAQELGLPVAREQLQVNALGPSGIRVNVKYTVPVDLILFDISIPFEYNFDSKSAL